MFIILIPSLLAITGITLASRVVYKKIPKEISELDKATANVDFGPAFYEKALDSFSLKSKQVALSAFTKLVYKLKITSLKTDNFFSRLLNEIKHHKTNIQESSVASTIPKEESNILADRTFKVQLTSIGDTEGIISIRKSEPPFGVKKAEPKIEPLSAFEKQEEQLISQLSYNAKDVSAYKRLGWLYLENNKPIEARQAFKTAVKLGSKDKIIVTKLLEMGGVVHKEGTGLHKPIQETKPVLASAPIHEVRMSKQKTRKLKVKKI
ncbi:MAG: tetratricopeptide repeat protein [bacterium]|nr:tetratricopeptide repeat protein [bacterium]